MHMAINIENFKIPNARGAAMEPGAKGSQQRGAGSTMRGHSHHQAGSMVMKHSEPS